MKAQGWKTKKRSSKAPLLSHIATSYTHPFSQELIILGVIWGKSPCIYRFSLYSLVRVEQERARYLAGKKEKNKKNRLLGRSERWKFPPLFYRTSSPSGLLPKKAGNTSRNQCLDGDFP